MFDHKKCETVKDYCTRPIYKERCDYFTQEWRAAGERTASGKGKELSWPVVADGDEVRLTYSATYTVRVTYEDGGTRESHNLISSVSRTGKATAESAAREYLSWDLGDPVALKINNLGGVAEARHAARIDVEAP